MMFYHSAEIIELVQSTAIYQEVVAGINQIKMEVQNGLK